MMKDDMKKIMPYTKLIESDNAKSKNERNDDVKRSQFLKTQVAKQKK